MIFDFITIIVVGAMLLFAGYTAMQFLGRFPRRSMDDVTPYLRPAEFEELESLLDPAQEVNFRLRLSPQEFRSWQRKRIHLMREYLLRMSHNSLVLIEWGNMELRGEAGSRCVSVETQAIAEELIQAATEFRLYSFLALAKLKLWIVFHIDMSASLPGLRNLFGIDSLGAYHRLKAAAGALGLAHGTEFHQALIGKF
ncbi:MAG TPA: hypothetical protein VFP59_04410 [Candidatus Angelobacter sp.]|nr:hypothetical protein [Candidatus Angelobacter sp.]